MTELSVVIPWRDRPELLQTLRDNAPHFTAAGAEVTVVNCGGDLASVPWSDLAGLGMPLARLDFERADFNKGCAINLGVHHSSAETLLLLDADILLGPETLPTLQTAFTSRAFVTVAAVIDAGRDTGATPPSLAVARVTHAVEFGLPDGTVHRINTNTLYLTDGARAGPGLVLLRRADFLAVGGMKNTLTGWGWDDIDLIARLQMALGLDRHETGRAEHVPHGAAPASLAQADKGASEARNYRICLADYAVGDFQGTFETDVAETTVARHRL
ncbi:galactosyltransferase-related protein [Rhodovulum sulfidophilum]|uniref:galactosyltransferase-related protein n=1 Tax=Rhodovulum sulfidophilum TaxID=35806 RepID=UPI001F37FA57|nr:galactosyltransferase-related protein [Rhodovulum sulfidophilum]MCE8440863.1 galactosyltransferase-related protein [Rhodovulum sulfidophilum]MCE8468626.1 galactosyltransferase-related protein [Rhodovulum sulfidophilum]